MEMEADEVAAVLRGSATPTADRARGTRRAARPPQHAHAAGHLGAVPNPSRRCSAMPAATAELLMTVRTGPRSPRHPGPGRTAWPEPGVGAQVARGRVRTARSPEEAISTLEPGEVLVVPFTTPAYNVVLPLCGGLVTTEGGPLSHAAVLARELGLAAGGRGAAVPCSSCATACRWRSTRTRGEVRLVSVATAPYGLRGNWRDGLRDNGLTVSVIPG